MKVSTRAYEGKIHKSARVHSNDPKHPLRTVSITAVVNTPISLSPRYVFFQGPTSESITKSVTIEAKLEKPLRIEPAEFTLDRWVKYRIEEIKEGRLFKVYFTSIPKSARYYSGYLALKTNYPQKPEIFVRIRARFIH